MHALEVPRVSLADSSQRSRGPSRPGVAYRCHICRLELVLDPETQHLTVASMRDGEDEKLR